jgi:PKD repeat protein
LNDATSANPIASPSATTSYILAVTDSLGCTDMDTVLVTVNPNPTADAGVDQQICPGDSASLGGAPSASGGAAGYTYSWSPTSGLSDATSANPKASPSATTTYILTVTDAKNCVAMDTVLVTVSSGLNADAGADQAIAVGGATTIGGAPSATGGIPPYTYSWSPIDSLDDATAANPTANPTSTTTYILTVTDAVGCTDNDTVEVVVSLLPIADAGPDTAICAGSSVVIGGSPTASAGAAPYSYSWSPSTGLHDATAANPIASPSATTTYIVTVTDANTNTDTDTMTVTICPNPSANAGADAVIILGDSTTLGGSPSASGGTAPYTYAWSPATGLNDATAANPIATPSDTTEYVLLITDSKGCSDTDTVIVYVNSINTPPTAVASANPTSGGAPLLVQFTGSGSTDIDGAIVSYAWDFGDGNSSTQADPQYTYNALGNPIARLIVTDNGGAKDTAFVNISVVDCFTLPSAPAYGKITGGDQTHVNEVTYCFAGVAGNRQLHYEIHDVDFGDEVAVRLNNAWSLPLSVFVPDSCILDNDTNILVFDNTKNPTNTNIWGVRNVSMEPPPANQLPEAVASANMTIGPAPLAVQFTGSASFDIDGTIAAYAWNFGDGNSSALADPPHTYSALGTYVAKLVVTDNGGLKDSTTVTIDVVACLALPDTHAYGKIPGGDQTHVDKVIYCFPAMSGSPMLAYQVYDIDTNVEGDVFLNNKKIIDLDPSGNNLWSATRTFSLPDSLVHDAATNVLVFDNTKNPPNSNEWGVRQVSVAGVAANIPPTAVASANPASGFAPLNVQFTGSSSTDSDGAIASYAWTFGDGGSSTQADPLYTYNTPASYAARLIVTDNLGATDTAFVNVQVNANLPPIAVASANVDSGEVPLAVNFTGSSSSDPDNGIASYLWNFGDGGSASTANASHTYTVAGNYTASLIVTDNGGLKDTATVNIKAKTPAGLPTIRVNVGGSLYTTMGGKVFSADQKYFAGSWGFIDSGFVRIETLAISGTPDPDLYRVQRERIQLDYRFDVPNGSYDVILHFAELKDNVALNRVMDVSLEGVLVLNDFDIYVQAPGKAVACQRRFNGVVVADGQLHLNMVKSLESYKRPCAIAAIEIGPAGVLPKAEEAEAPQAAVEIPSKYSLEQNYPNPFNPSTNLVFNLPEPGEVKLVIYNANGQFVRKVVDRHLDAGRHTVRFNASKLPSGTYFYELHVNDFHVRRKMILTR